MKPVQVKTVSEATKEDIEQTGFVVCAYEGTVTPFTDNLSGACNDCGARLIFRPNVPDKPKICMACAMDRINGGEA